MTLRDEFAACFDAPKVTVRAVLGQKCTEVPRTDKIRALANHPNTPEDEREAARRALQRIERSEH